MTIAIVAVFLIGYFFIATESVVKVNKSATALFMCVICWVLYMMGSMEFLPIMHGDEFNAIASSSEGSSLVQQIRNFISSDVLLDHLGDTCETIFFLMGAMTIVEIVDSNGGFNFVRDRLSTKSKKALLWRVVFITFFLSAVLDNLTTSLVMIMVLRKLVPERNDRLIYAAMVILAANSGGAFSPIGDVTTIMLWIKGNITSLGVLKEVFLPSVISVVVPAFLISFQLKGTLGEPSDADEHKSVSYFTRRQRAMVFIVGVGGLVMVPIFRTLTGLPPFMGVLLVLSILWIMIEMFLKKVPETDSLQHRVSDILHKIDMSTLLFFLGILMTVAVLQEIGVLKSFGQWLDTASGNNAYLITGIIGIVSSIVDNVPLVASCIGMYSIAPATAGPELANFMVDGHFWQLLAFCAGTGGSILIIGSAAGVAVMGLENISFGWYLKKISWVALIGYLAGVVTYWLQAVLIYG